jgi:sugar lactone lactonase YvrE
LPEGGYFTDPENQKVWHVDQNLKSRVVDQGIRFPNGVITSPDQSLLYVSDTRGHFIYSFQIQSNGDLAPKQKYFHLHVPDNADDSGADGMAVDDQGWLYVATRMGVQVLDQAGRVNGIIPKPQSAWLSNVVIGGKEMNTLYVTCGDKVYRRQLRTRAALSWKNIVTPPKVRL